MQSGLKVERVELISYSVHDPGNVTVAIEYEDHTLGNALRHVIMNIADVDLVGYSNPHPSEPKFHFRIQLHEWSQKTALDVLAEGLEELGKCAKHLYETMEADMEKARRDPSCGIIEQISYEASF
ncbi:hypothetical protein MIR68_007128 [Amoeboaphelidium protococcarum]|nr:hypothetical protein MIR68_010416 [Amoeboaphelidium protococcarum]KAI3634747.1 hypothetical protein MIR68_007128 [Amoeboaphelidium protococcarum]KAI3645228.1 hypothetical protein MP228_011392 [Amoeboaphelidium protococcarum]KAI3652641.1 hypothetical protein MP228_002066 [Amoeboaphelidium protococcarum]